MAQTKKVLLCGNSLFIAGLQTSLESVSDLQLTRLDARTDWLWKRLREEVPDVLILELGTMPGDQSLTLLKEFPRLMLIGLDPESDHLLVLSVQEQTPLAVADLVRVIRGQTDVPTERR